MNGQIFEIYDGAMPRVEAVRRWWSLFAGLGERWRALRDLAAVGPVSHDATPRLNLIDSRGRHPRFGITVRFYGGTNDILQGPTYGRLTVD